MNFKASMRSGLIIVAGVLACATGLARAAEGDATPDATANVGTATDTSAEAPAPRRHRRHAVKKAAAKPNKVAIKGTVKPDDDRAAADAKSGDSASMSPKVANANAQWPAQATPDTTSNMAAQADNVLQQVAPQPEQPASAAPADSQPSAQVMASSQLNDLDRAATDQPAPVTLAKVTETPAAAQDIAGPEVASSDTTWDRTSMIGKVFIAFGGVLTMASAVRMFMA